MAVIKYPMQRIGCTVAFRDYNPFGTVLHHYATDISSTQPVSYDVNAAHDGKVVLSTYDSAGGNIVGILGYYNEKKDILTRYAHLLTKSVSVGATVTQGQKIGVQGATGTAAIGRHLHFETWLVPKNYSYKAADRPTYAFDPHGICHLFEGQQFYRDKETNNCDAMPYPEPVPGDLAANTGKLTIVNGILRLRMLPWTQYSYMCSGGGRTKTTVGTLCPKQTVFTVSHTCSTVSEDGSKNNWALIDTEYGWLWISVIDGYSKLELDNPAVTPVTPTPDPPVADITVPEAECNKMLEEIRARISTYEGAVAKVTAASDKFSLASGAVSDIKAILAEKY